MFCLNESDVFGEPFWKDKKLFGPYGRDGLSFSIFLASCGSAETVLSNKAGLITDSL